MSKDKLNQPYFTASEATKMAQTAIDRQENALNAQLLEILDSIKTIADSGAFQYVHDGHLREPVTDRLKSLGYSVKTGSQMNEPYTHIEWWPNDRKYTPTGH